MREVLAIAHDARREARVVLVGSSVLVDPIETDSFLYRVSVPLSPARAVDLNEQLANQITKRTDLMADPGLKFVPMFIGTRTRVGDSDRTA